MTGTVSCRRPGIAARRLGYPVAVVVNAVLLYAVNRWPGWDAVPFLTADTRLVLGLVNAAIVVNVVANLVYLLRDPWWFKALGDMVTTTVGVVALLRIWQVFPFDVGGGSVDWALVLRVVLAVAIGGSIIGVVAGLARLVRSVGVPSGPRAKPR